MKRLLKPLKGKDKATPPTAPTPSSPPTDPSPSSTPEVTSFPDGIKVWHDCTDANIDLCFVHGLTGNRDTTWTADGESMPWPQAFIPPELPKARVLTYGYDAYVVRKGAAGSNRLIDHATNLLHDLTRDRVRSPDRPLFFVAHSLGGLVCKKAILHSRNNPDEHLRGIFESTKGIIFMGTPHKGSWKAHWATIPVSVFGLVKSTSPGLLDVLQPNNQLLESLHVDFANTIRELELHNVGKAIQVTCFVEELNYGTAGRIVPKDSAIFEGRDPISIHANHRQMVKFASPQDTGFKRLIGELVRWESKIGI